MGWLKLGSLYVNNTINSKYLFSHAANPLPVHLNDNIFRVYFSARDSKNRSSVGSFDWDIKASKIIQQPAKFVHKFGDKGTFYNHGISIGSFYESKGRKFVLFMGWQLTKGQHWSGAIGRFEIFNSGKWKITSAVPFFSLDGRIDKFSLSYPAILIENGVYKMWYGSTVDWTSNNGEMIHVINYATSYDGKNWHRHGIAIPFKIGKAQAFSRPSVIHDDQGYHMWFSYRSGDGTPYRIGYANSSDGIKWDLALNESKISVSESGWDSEMICYPCVFDFNRDRFMLYNGNGFGKTGIGLAKWIA